jgi:hypothetical protein
MAESRAALKQRLLHEGRWEAFKTRREELKAQGKTPQEAWEITISEYGPIQSGDQAGMAAASNNGSSADHTGGSVGDSGCVPESGISKALPKKKRGSITKDFEWVYWNIGDPAVTPGDAPSLSAWWMLEKVRSNPTAQLEFIRTLLQRLRPDKNESESERFNDDGRAQLGLIERVRAASKNALLPSGA